MTNLVCLKLIRCSEYVLNYFTPLIFFYTPLKTLDLLLSNVFRGYRKRPVTWDGLRNLFVEILKSFSTSAKLSP